MDQNGIGTLTQPDNQETAHRNSKSDQSSIALDELRKAATLTTGSSLDLMECEAFAKKAVTSAILTVLCAMFSVSLLHIEPAPGSTTFCLALGMSGIALMAYVAFRWYTTALRRTILALQSMRYGISPV